MAVYVCSDLVDTGSLTYCNAWTVLDFSQFYSFNYGDFVQVLTAVVIALILLWGVKSMFGIILNFMK